MNFSYFNDRDELFIFPITESPDRYFPVQASEDARYIISDHDDSDIISLVTAERHNNDLHLTVASASPALSTLVIVDFYKTNGKVFTLNKQGEYQQHIVANSYVPQGPVIPETQPAVVAEAQPESASLKALQHAETVQSLEKLAARLNLSAEDTLAEQPQVRLASPEALAISVKPVITAMYDAVGTSTGKLESGNVTDDKRPVFEGTGQPGSTLEFYLNAELADVILVGPEGEWRYRPEIPLDQGGQLFYVRDPETNQSSTYVVLHVDTVAPARVVLTSVTSDNTDSVVEVAKNGYTRDSTPTFSGSAEPNTVITIYNDKTPIGTTRAAGTGLWSYTLPYALPDGVYSIKVTATDFAGNTGLASTKFDFTLDTTPPEKPQIGDIEDNKAPHTGTIKDGGSTNDNMPTIKGTGTPHDIVIVLDNGNPIGQVEIGSDGTWMFTPERGLTDEVHNIQVIIQDPAGNQSVPSEPWRITVDTAAPDAPAIGCVYDDVGVHTGQLASGGSTDDTRPTLSGTAEPEASIEIYNGDQKIGKTTADGDGNWSFTPDNDLQEGEYKFTATATDAAGNTSSPSGVWEVIIDTTPPAQPGIDGNGPGISGVTVDKEPYPGEIEDGGSTNDDTPTFHGMGTPGDTVIVLDNGNPIGEVDIGEDGTWTFTPEKGLEDDEHKIQVIIQDPAGNQSEPSDEWVVIVDATAPDAPIIGGVYDDVGLKTGNLKNGESTDDARPTLSGTAEPDASIEIYNGDGKIGTTTADADGSWSFTPNDALEDGEYKLTVTATDAVGNTSAPSAEWELTIHTVAPDAPMIGSLYDHIGNVTGPLGNGESTDDTHPTLSGTAKPGNIVTLYGNDGKWLGEAEADEEGRWSITPEEALEAGEHRFTAQAQDAVGNLSAMSAVWETTLVLSLPDAPVIESVLDDVGPDTGELISGEVTDDRRPEVKGQSEPGATVILYANGDEVGRGQADSEGRWSVTPRADLKDDVYRLTTVVQDHAGNDSPPSEVFEVVIYAGDGPTQIARIGQMGKDSGYDGNDFVTDNGDAGRMMYGTLSTALTSGQRLQVSTDGGRSWSDAMTEGTQWAAQDWIEHVTSWSIQTRVIDASGKVGFVMQQAVTLDTTVPESPTSVHLEESSLTVEFSADRLVAGDRLSIVTDAGAHRFEHTLTTEDIAAGSISIEVGNATNASASLIDMAGNQSAFVSASGLPVRGDIAVKGDVEELYGTNNGNDFTVADVNLLANVKIIEGNGETDTLKLTGANQVLDLSAWQGRLSSVETIDITGTGDNVLRLSLGDLLDLGHTNAFISDDCVQLAVLGNEGDVVKLIDQLPNGMRVGEWELVGEVKAGDPTYDVYLHSELGVELLIQQGVTLQFS